MVLLPLDCFTLPDPNSDRTRKKLNRKKLVTDDDVCVCVSMQRSEDNFVRCFCLAFMWVLEIELTYSKCLYLP